MRVRDIMVTHVVTIDEDRSALDGLKLLAVHDVTGLPVIGRDGAVIGLVSEADLLRYINIDDDRVDTSYLESMTIKKLVYRKLIATSPETRLIDVAHQMIINKVKRLPVLDDGDLVGVISRSDIVRFIVDRVTR